MRYLLSGQSKSAVLLFCGALLSACGGKSLQINESSKPDAQSGASGAGAAGPSGASDAGAAGASDGGFVDASDAGLTDGDSNASVLPPSDQPWKSTPTPLCVGTGMQVSAHSVWSNGRSVYVVAASLGSSSGHLFSNDGHGWVQADTPFDGSFLGVTGFAPGPLVVSQQSGSCGINFLTNDSETCSAPLYSVAQVAAVNASLAFAVSANGVDPTQVVRYNGTYWSDSGLSFDDGDVTPVVAGAVAAVPGLLGVINKGGALHLFKMGQDGTGAVPLAVAAPRDIYDALWAFSPTDVWAGSLTGDLVHFDGASWSLVTRAAGCAGIKGIWGNAGNVYFITDSTVEEWSNGMARPLYQAPCGTLDFTAIWGNSSSELFITLSEPGLDATACGASRTLWYDGGKFGEL